nr:MAG TPA: GlpM protein [Caudoviricetes sp.]
MFSWGGILTGMPLFFVFLFLFLCFNFVLQ